MTGFGAKKPPLFAESGLATKFLQKLFITVGTHGGAGYCGNAGGG